MDSKYSIRGLQAKHGFYKSVFKGEDTWTQKPGLKLSTSNWGVGASEIDMPIYGVFDGHGGKQAATFAARNLVDRLLAALGEATTLTYAEDETILRQLQDHSGVKQEDLDTWESHDQVIEALPEALVEAFEKLQTDFFAQCKESGTTATLAALVGWELLVANVGDSSAFLDTGSEVVQVSGNHRLDDNKSEQDRILAEGYEVSSSRVEGRPCGPLRVWPGGLAMGRTLGDFEAGDIVLCEPEVRQVTLPATGGRVIIASDGLWDSVAPKTAAHHVRGMPATKAARELGQAALKAKGLRDDITVLVIDFVPSEDFKMPPLLAKDGSGYLQAASAPVTPVSVLHPLPDHGDKQRAYWHQMQWERRLEAVQSCEPKPTQKLQTRGSDSLSLEDCGTPMVSAASHATDGGGNPSDSENSETTAANLTKNPYALVDEDGYELNDLESESTWETVPVKPAKSKAVPAAGRKHALPLSEGSPSEPWQVPKALKEAPPSPGFSPMQTSDLGSSEPRGSQPGRGGRRGGRGQGRGRGRGGRGGGGGGGRGFQPQPVAPHHIHVNGFAVPHTESQAPAAPQQPNQGGMSFLEGGGFSFNIQPPAATAVPIGYPPTDFVAPAGEGTVEDRPRRGRNPRQRSRGNPRPEKDRAAVAGMAGEGDSGPVEGAKQPEQRRKYRPRRQPANAAEGGQGQEHPVPRRQQSGRRQGKSRQEGGNGGQANNSMPAAPVA